MAQRFQTKSLAVLPMAAALACGNTTGIEQCVNEFADELAPGQSFLLGTPADPVDIAYLGFAEQDSLVQFVFHESLSLYEAAVDQGEFDLVVRGNVHEGTYDSVTNNVSVDGARLRTCDE